jgi:hypothetical protein
MAVTVPIPYKVSGSFLETLLVECMDQTGSCRPEPDYLRLKIPYIILLM